MINSKLKILAIVSIIAAGAAVVALGKISIDTDRWYRESQDYPSTYVRIDDKVYVLKNPDRVSQEVYTDRHK